MPVKVEHYFYFRPMQIIITLQLSPVCANAITIIIIQPIIAVFNMPKDIRTNLESKPPCPNVDGHNNLIQIVFYWGFLLYVSCGAEKLTTKMQFNHRIKHSIDCITYHTVPSTRYSLAIVAILN